VVSLELVLYLIAACSGSDSPRDFEGGDFDFFTTDAVDGCLAGAMEVLFMPEGPDTPHPFEFPIHVPSWNDLPESYEIDLRAPFLGMPVTVEAGEDGTYAIRGAVMEAVELDPVKFGDCVATMTVDADLSPTSADDLAGEARIDISDPRGEDDLCPVFDADPCLVSLTLEAHRR